MLVISLASWSAALLRRFAWLGCMPALESATPI
jgi:hypothetical protein